MRNNDQKMINQNSIENLWNFRKQVFAWSISLAMTFFIVSAIIPASYKAFASVAINQKRTAGIDAYREAKSSEFMARTVKEMIMSNSFMRDVLKDDGIIWAEMNKIQIQDERIKYWKKKVKVSVIPNTGVLSILVYTRDRELSKKILIKTIDQLQGQKATFLADRGVKIEVINEPYYFHKQATPNLVLNTVLGFVIGLILSTVIVFFGRKDLSNNLKNGILQKNKKTKHMKYTEFSSREIDLFSKSQHINFDFK